MTKPKHPISANQTNASGKNARSSAIRSAWDDFFDAPGIDLGPRHQFGADGSERQRKLSMIEGKRDGIELDDLIVSDPEIMGGRRIFRGTRVPVEVLFENLADGMSLDEILSEYETLSRDDVVRVLELMSSVLTASAAA